MKKVILHLCADIGSDSYPYLLDPEYEVIRVGKEIGVENYTPDRTIYGIIANPVCTDYSSLHNLNKYKRTPDLSMVKHCQRIIKEANPVFWCIENPWTGKMKDYLGKPTLTYQPWQYGSPWTKQTALWGEFNIPKRKYLKWEDVPRNENLYVRPGRLKPSLAFLHKSAIEYIPEFAPFKQYIDSDSAFRSLCSQGFANAFKEANQ